MTTDTTTRLRVESMKWDAGKNAVVIEFTSNIETVKFPSLVLSRREVLDSDLRVGEWYRFEFSRVNAREATDTGEDVSTIEPDDDVVEEGEEGGNENPQTQSSSTSPEPPQDGPRRTVLDPSYRPLLPGRRR